MGVVKAFGKLIKAILVFVLIFIICEAGAQVAYRIKYHKWRFKNPGTYYTRLFRAHPYLAVELIPDAKFTSNTGIRFEHTKFGFRGEVQSSLAKKEGLRRILVFGGSSTYGVGVSNNQTWPYYLNDDLKDKFEVINLGVPGYSTVEHVVQTALNISDFSPDICIYYIGWNDIRNIHIANLKSDYSDFHGRSQYNNLQLGASKIVESSIIIKAIVLRFKKPSIRKLEGWYKIEPTADKFTPRVEKRALDLYKRNIRLIILLARSQGARVIMVPQVLNYEKLTKDKPYGWIPYLNDKDVRAVMNVYNDALQQVCALEGVDFVKEVLEEKFTGGDFVDHGHFSSRGNKKFAGIIAKYISKNVVPLF